MPRERTFLSGFFCFAAFILLEVASFLMFSNSSKIQKLWIASLSHSFMIKTWGTSQSASNYLSLKKQNDELALENSYLRKELLNWQQAAMAEDSTFRPDTAGNGFRYTPSTIIKASTNTQHNYLIIDKGSEDGIKENSGIITSKGVVGIVDAVSKHYSYAISFLNTDLNISARLGKEGAVGPLAWDGKSTDGAILKEIPLQYKFAPGDTVYTSGYSTIFPPDIPIGVTGKSKIINGATNEIHVTLFQNQSALRYVTVIENTNAGEIDAVENQKDIQKK